MHAIALTARSAGRSLPRQLLIRALHAGSRQLDRLAAQLAQTRCAEEPSAHLEYQFDPATGQGALYEDGVRRFTFLQGLERL